MQLSKIDIHLHLSPEEIYQSESQYISSAESMIFHLEELGIKKGILMSTSEFKNDSILFGSNEENRKITLMYPEIYSWMCNIDPVDIDTIYNRMKLYKEQGAVGVGELIINKRLDNPILQKILESAEKLNMPILFHMSPKEGFQYGVVDEPGLPILEECLKKYPKLKFIGHSQVFWHEISADAKPDDESRNQWGVGRVDKGGRIEYLMDKYSNLYADLSANSGGCAIMRDEEYGIYFIEKFKDRLMFGTDMVNVIMEFPLGKWLDEKFKAQLISEEAYYNICFKNAEKLFF